MILQFDVPFFLLYLTSFLSYTHLPIYLPLNGIIVKEERAWKAFIYRPSLLGRILKDLSLSFMCRQYSAGSYYLCDVARSSSTESGARRKRNSRQRE